MKELDLKIDVSFFEDVISIMLSFLTNKVPFFSHFPVIFQIFCFSDRFEKCGMSEVSTKNRNIWDTNSINMWILADEDCRFTNFFNITS